MIENREELTFTDKQCFQSKLPNVKEQYEIFMLKVESINLSCSFGIHPKALAIPPTLDLHIYSSSFIVELEGFFLEPKTLESKKITLNLIESKGTKFDPRKKVKDFEKIEDFEGSLYSEKPIISNKSYEIPRSIGNIEKRNNQEIWLASVFLPYESIINILTMFKFYRAFYVEIMCSKVKRQRNITTIHFLTSDPS